MFIRGAFLEGRPFNCFKPLRQPPSLFRRESIARARHLFSPISWRNICCIFCRSVSCWQNGLTEFSRSPRVTRIGDCTFLASSVAQGRHCAPRLCYSNDLVSQVDRQPRGGRLVCVVPVLRLLIPLCVDLRFLDGLFGWSSVSFWEQSFPLLRSTRKPRQPLRGP